MNKSIIFWITLILQIFNTIYTTSQKSVEQFLPFNCRKNPILNKCPQNSWCNPSGLCICNTYFYGSNCELSIYTSYNLQITKNGISMELYNGMIIGFILCYVFVLIIGLLIIYFKLKDKDY